jgi:hypothetical protein
MKMPFKNWLIGLGMIFALLFIADARLQAHATPPSAPGADLYVSETVYPTLSPAVRDLPPYQGPEIVLDLEINPRLNATGIIYTGPTEFPGLDTLLAVQAAAAPAAPNGFTTPIFNFDGQGYTFVNPPDTVGDVGIAHYIQMINSGGTSVAIYDKATSNLITQFELTSLGGCSTGSGDPIVLYDELADRWLLSEFGSGNSVCVFISQTPDPTGAYHSYQFPTPSFPDYPKYGVWPDAYYFSANENSPSAYALNRTAMLSGAPATAQGFTAPVLSGFPFQALTPSDLDGSTPPPAGSPNYFMRHRDTEVHGNGNCTVTAGQDCLEIWAFDVDFTTPANSSFTEIADIPIANIDSSLCGLSSFNCFPMPGTSTTLDPLREVIMFRLAYRNFGSHETLVGNLVTDVDNTDHGGVRWFELRKQGANPWSLFQEGTFAPDAHHRWMGAIAMDGSGNIAVGYNVSSTTLYPSLRYVGRLASDPLGTMPQGEAILVTGTAANGSNRYGDYAAMSVDPVDDCTFWFTGEYNTGSGWSTRIGAFKFDQCGTADFTLAVTPDTQAVCQPDPAVFTVNVGQVQDYDDPVTLSAEGHPAGTIASFAPNPVVPAGSSTFTLSNMGAAAGGNYSIDVIGIAATSTHTATVSLDVYTAVPGAPTLVSPANGATNLPLRPTFTWETGSGAASYFIEIATDAGFTNIVASATVDTPTYTPGTDLAPATFYFWRVTASNPCGEGVTSASRFFSTLTAPGACSPMQTPNVLLGEGFESGSTPAGWSHSGTGDTWAASTAQVHVGTYSFHANDPTTVSAQYLYTPQIILPSDEFPLSLQFWNHQTIEDNGTTGCYDGALIDISTDGGTTWTQIETGLLTDPYNGVISSGYSNPRAGDNAWCGDPQDWLNSVVDLNAYAGQTIQVRFGMTSDSTVSREGWYVDEVVVQSCLTENTTGTLKGTVTDAETGNPLTDVTISVIGPIPGVTTTNVSGQYTLTLPIGSYDVMATATGYSSASVSGIEVVTDTNATVDFALLALQTSPTVAVGPTSLSTTLGPDTLLEQTLTISNTGQETLAWNLSETGTSDCSLPSGIPWVSAAPITGTLSGGSASPVAVTFDTTGLGLGVYTGSLCIQSNDPAQPLVTVPLTLTVEVTTYSVALSGNQTASGEAGTTVSYVVTITNTGTTTDTFTLAATGAWTATLSETTVTLGAGASTTFMVEVEIPVASDEGDSEVIIITATSQSYPVMSDSAELTTTVIVSGQEEFRIFLPIVIQ